jgi:hypothetical protein
MDFMLFLNYILLALYICAIYHFSTQMNYLGVVQVCMCVFLAIKRLDDILDIYAVRYNMID